jgi:acyl dehydratase
MAFEIEHVGEWTDEQRFDVEASRTEAYAAATNDPIEEHRLGKVAPPVFAVVPVWDAIAGAIALVTPPEVMLNVLHGEQDMTFHRPITPGMTLVSKASPVGVHVKRSGTTVVSKLESRDAASGELVNEQYTVTFFRGASDGDSAGEEAPSHRLAAELRSGEPVAEVEQTLDSDQTYRYSEASGDMVPIHLDAEIAKAVGLPGIIIHGLCTMAFNSWAAVEQLAGGDTARLKRLAVRFSRPVLPGETITTRFWEAGDNDRRTTYVFETVNPEGETVIKDGLVEIAP